MGGQQGEARCPVVPRRWLPHHGLTPGVSSYPRLLVLSERDQARPSFRFTSSHGLTRPAATSSSLSFRAAITSGSLRTSSVSIRDSYSASDITTAAGRPLRVMTMCSRISSISSNNSVRWARASEKGTVLATGLLYAILHNSCVDQSSHDANRSHRRAARLASAGRHAVPRSL